MRGIRFTFPAAAAVVLGCADTPDSGAGPRSDLPAPAGAEDDSDQPIRLGYVCGNRFLIASAHSVPITVSFRVEGSAEEGSATLAAAPAQDPGFSEALIETRTRGTVEVSSKDGGYGRGKTAGCPARLPPRDRRSSRP